ncbi:PEPxxWA-CTERM sorting domain-containing protein [Glacieibacterium frigidum]|uniref:PEP-CTERM sorting domain-containing protein n=1 Tax=Glacieibacterium frigidum TaxID=2593303 RepID=A0A552UIR2_9SPHN|nr:PEPxxWA-CTERM sorting domain-containing protein [Glacieibacterium frigidum]TRW18112.1 PEP-CTERM sorting domain-containing protein [Glacieibacterium frigidum]
MSISYRSVGALGNGGTVSSPLYWWSGGYGDLSGVLYAESGFVGELTFTVTAPGTTLVLQLVDFAGYQADYGSGVRLYDLSYNLLDNDTFTAPEVGHYTSILDVSTTTGFVLQFGPEGYYAGLDNLVYFLNVAAVPEPTIWALLIGGFGLTGAAMRRRRTLAA